MACPTTAVSWMMSVGLAWEWLEGNLGMRAAMAVAKVVERGRVVGFEDLSGRLLRGGKGVGGRGDRGWGFWTEWDENFVNSSHFCNLCTSFVLLYHNLLRCISLHKVFGVNFKSRESDHTAVSKAPNNPGLDTSHVSKVLTAALEGSFV